MTSQGLVSQPAETQKWKRMDDMDNDGRIDFDDVVLYPY